MTAITANRVLLWASVLSASACIVQFYRGRVYRTRPTLVVYVALWGLTRLVPAHTSSPHWHMVWSALTAVLLPGRVAVTVEAVRELTRDLGYWRRRWMLAGTYAYSAAVVGALLLTSTIPASLPPSFPSLVALTEYVSIGLAVGFAIICTYVMAAPRRLDLRPPFPTLIHAALTLTVLTAYAVSTAFTPRTGLAASFVLVDTHVWTLVHRTATVIVIGCLAVWAVAPLPVPPRPGGVMESEGGEGREGED